MKAMTGCVDGQSSSTLTLIAEVFKSFHSPCFLNLSLNGLVQDRLIPNEGVIGGDHEDHLLNFQPLSHHRTRIPSGIQPIQTHHFPELVRNPLEH